jgi:membrane fusion protein, multidrug efflux system
VFQIFPKHKRYAAVSTLAIFAGMVWLAACAGTKAAQPTAPPPVPVLSAVAVKKDVPLQVRAIGAVEAYSMVSVRTQVTGELTGVFFREGDFVKKGSLLFTLDKRQYEADLHKAEGDLARDQAQAENAHAQTRRYESLWKAGVVSKEQFDQIKTSADTYDAAVRADQAAVENAKVQLTYCTIYSPIDGKTGNLIVHQGNMVKANDNPLVTINQVQPIYTTFTVPEQFLADVKKFVNKGRLKVAATIPNDASGPADGTLSFVDNMVDQSTGTIKLKAQFVNADRRLWPGQFVNVALTLSTYANATVVPSQAIQTGQQGAYVFVINPDMTVQSRPVTIAQNLDGQAVIEKGVSPGDQVVTDGQLRLIPGSKVQVKSSVSPQPATREAEQQNASPASKSGGE